jgi:small subunit ribosomal protein S13
MRILGITIPDQKKLEYGLTTIFGIGLSRSRAVLKEVKIDPATKSKDLTDDQENSIRAAIEKFVIEGDLKRTVSSNVKRLKDIGSYRGTRHTVGLPSRGQRTKTNSRTNRGNVRKTMASGRRAVSKT